MTRTDMPVGTAAAAEGPGVDLGERRAACRDPQPAGRADLQDEVVLEGMYQVSL